MTQNALLVCGLLLPVSYILLYVVGGALRPGYSHISDSVSELLTVGAPNKSLLLGMQLIYAVLHILFGIGVLGVVGESTGNQVVGSIGAWMIILLGLATFGTAIFPQDAEGASPTTPGRTHIVLVFGGLIPLSILSTGLIGYWSSGAGLPSWFDIYSYATVGAIVVMGGIGGAAASTQYAGLSERVAALTTHQWLFVLALVLLQ